MIRVVYIAYCDVCADAYAEQTYLLGTGAEMPKPDGLRVFNNVALCETCAELAVPAMNEALKSRLKVQEH